MWKVLASDLAPYGGKTCFWCWLVLAGEMAEFFFDVMADVVAVEVVVVIAECSGSEPGL